MSNSDITCKRCGALIPAADVGLQHMAAKCRSCDAVFSIAEQFALTDESIPMARRDVPLPRRFTIENLDGALRIRWRWFTLRAIPKLVATLLINGMLWTLLVAGSAEEGNFSASLCFMPWVIAGLCAGYFALADILNTTWVEASLSDMIVRHGPILVSRGLSISRDSLRQIYCVERERRSAEGAPVSYDLQAITADGSSMTLIKGLPNAEQALYLEQEIERCMGIADEMVRSELWR